MSGLATILLALFAFYQEGAHLMRKLYVAQWQVNSCFGVSQLARSSQLKENRFWSSIGP